MYKRESLKRLLTLTSKEEEPEPDFQGLKLCAFKRYGSNWIQLVQPRRRHVVLHPCHHVLGLLVPVAVLLPARAAHAEVVQGVAVQVEFESKGLKPVSHLIGSRVETRRFQAMGQLDSTCTAPPGRTSRGSAARRRGTAP
jgi:hypothetical protein